MQYLNRFRALAGLPPLSENAAWSFGGQLHARYMVKEDEIGHGERASSPWYTAAGDAAARNGNLFIASVPGLDATVPIDRWMGGPFHMLGIVDPQLASTGYGEYSESIGIWRYGAVLDILRGRTASIPAGTYPVEYPRPGGKAFLLEYRGDEYPDPLTPCLGYEAPTGAPIALQVGSGGGSPQLSFSLLLRDGLPVPHCAYDPSDYTNIDAAAESLGSQILDSRDAVILMPRDPLIDGSVYSVTLVVDGESHVWSFEAVQD